MTEATTSLLNTRTPNIRDRRDRRWFWQDNALVEDYARILGIYAVGVYMVLAERAYNQTQRAEVSGGVIAELLGVGRSSVTEALFALELHEIIDIQEQYDNETRQQLASVYTLLSVENWKLEPTPEREKYVNARREAEKARRTTPKDKPKRVTRRKKAEVSTDATAPKQGIPPEIIPPSTTPKKRGYAVTRHTLSSGAAYPLVSPGKGIPPDTDKYNQDVIQDEKQDNNKQPLAARMSVADESSIELELAPSAREQSGETTQGSLTQTLLDFAQTREIKIAPTEIDLLLSRWPAAKLRDDQLADALMRDYEIYGLDKPADEAIARQAAKTDPERLRWFLCAWSGFDEAYDDYHEKTKNRWTKTACFFKKWRTAQPPATWLERELANLRHETLRDAEKAADADAKTFWETLKSEQKRALDKEVVAVLDEESGGEKLSANADARAAKRRELLLDGETRAWLAGLGNGASAALEGRAGPPGHAAAPPPRRPLQLTIELYVGPILEEVRRGQLTVAELEDARPELLLDHEWRAVAEEVEKRARAERLVA